MVLSRPYFEPSRDARSRSTLLAVAPIVPTAGATTTSSWSAPTRLNATDRAGLDSCAERERVWAWLFPVVSWHIDGAAAGVSPPGIVGAGAGAVAIGRATVPAVFHPSRLSPRQRPVVQRGIERGG